MAVTFAFRTGNGQLYVDVFSDVALSGTASLAATFSYTASLLKFDRIVFPGSAAVNISSSIVGSTGSVSFTSSASAPASTRTEAMRPTERTREGNR